MNKHELMSSIRSIFGYTPVAQVRNLEIHDPREAIKLYANNGRIDEACHTIGKYIKENEPINPFVAKDTGFYESVITTRNHEIETLKEELSISNNIIKNLKNITGKYESNLKRELEISEYRRKNSYLNHSKALEKINKLEREVTALKSEPAFDPNALLKDKSFARVPHYDVYVVSGSHLAQVKALMDAVGNAFKFS